MADKPSYLGLLNAVSNAETRAYCYLTAWAEVTTDPDVRAVLLTVAAREGEHGWHSPSASTSLASSCSPPTTRDSRTAWPSRRRATRPTSRSSTRSVCSTTARAEGEPDVFDNFFRDHSIDIQTGELLGRYIAEERDTLRLVSGCASILKSRTNGSASPSADQLAGLENKVDAVCRAVEELRQIVCAQAMPATA